MGVKTAKIGVRENLAFVSPSADSRRAVVSYRQKYVHEVLVNCLGGLSLPRKSVVRVTDHPDMIIDVYRGRETTTTLRRMDTLPGEAIVPPSFWPFFFLGVNT